ncbi:Y4MH-like protein, partial [Mya arenaria]
CILNTAPGLCCTLQSCELVGLYQSGYREGVLALVLGGIVYPEDLASEEFKYPWPTPDMQIYKDYWPCGLERNIKNTPVKHAVFVQCLNASFGGIAEAEWMMDMVSIHPARKPSIDLHRSRKTSKPPIHFKPHCRTKLFRGSGLIAEDKKDTWKAIDYQPFIDHVLSVFGVDRCVFGSDWPVFENAGLDSVITSLKANGCLKGARHLIDFEADDWLTRDDVSRGLVTLAKHDLTFDLAVRHEHLPLVTTVVAKHPSLRFIINHIAEPIFTEGKKTDWWDDMEQIGKYPNVFCKISGLIAENKKNTWKAIDYQPFIDHVISVFGVDRCVFGSDWPVFENAGAKGCLKGARQTLDSEADGWITRDDVSKGIETLAKHDLTFDLLVRPHHLPLVPTVVAKCPSLRFIIYHIANPIFSEGRMTGWWDDMARIAKLPNVFCKISGLISEQKEGTWSSIDYQPKKDTYLIPRLLQHLLSVFGADRYVFGSDWPVFENIGVTYKENLAHTEKLMAKLDQNDRLKIFRENAIRFYKLDFYLIITKWDMFGLPT